MSGHDSTFATQARAADTLRWGGRTALSWGPASAAGGNAAVNLARAINTARGKLGAQLVNAHWRWPLTWNTLVCLRPQFAPDETGSIIVAVDWTIGSGDAQQTFTTTYTLQPGTTGLYQDILDTSVVLPAADVQVTLSPTALRLVGGEVPGPNTASVDMLEIGVFVAPVTEPHAGLHAADVAQAVDDANRQDGTWMPPGFTPEQLGYRR